MDRVLGHLSPLLLNRSPNFAFIGGTVIIAIMVMTAFANLANAGGCSYSKSAEATPEQMMEKQGDKKKVEA